MGFPAKSDHGADRRMHVPVMAEEVVELLSAPRPHVIVDATCGTGGHSEALLSRAAEAKLLGIDRDADALAVASARLGRFGSRVKLVQASFARIDGGMAEAGFERAGAGAVPRPNQRYPLEAADRRSVHGHLIRRDRGNHGR